MATSRDLVALEHGDESGETGATATPQLHNPPVKKVLTRETVPQRTIDRRRQPFARFNPWDP